MDKNLGGQKLLCRAWFPTILLCSSWTPAYLYDIHNLNLICVLCIVTKYIFAKVQTWRWIVSKQIVAIHPNYLCFSLFFNLYRKTGNIIKYQTLNSFNLCVETSLLSLAKTWSSWFRVIIQNEIRQMINCFKYYSWWIHCYINVMSDIAFSQTYFPDMITGFFTLIKS